MINSAATIITSHSPYFKYLHKLLNTFYENVEQPHPIYIVFSNHKEAKEFELSCNKSFNTLILPEELRGFKSIVNVKKLWAIEQLQNQYKWLGVYDCEVEYVKPVKLDNLYYEIGKEKVFKANTATIGGNILNKIAIQLGLDNNENVKRETRDFKVYWWFQNIPVYDTDETPHFLKWLNELDLNSIRNEYYCFDFLMYSLYLIAFRNWKVDVYDFHLDVGAVEQFRLAKEERIKIIEEIKPAWSVDKTNHNKYPFIKLIFHSDNAV